MARSNAAQMRPPVKELPSTPAGGYDEVSELLGVVVDHERRRGRGAHSNASGRYESLARIAFDDGWRTLDELPPFKTTVSVDATRKIITRNKSPDIGFDRSINPYRGCEHGCIYCFARPTHAYLGLSPGLDFESDCCSGETAAVCSGVEQSEAGHAREPGIRRPGTRGVVRGREEPAAGTANVRAPGGWPGASGASPADRPTCPMGRRHGVTAPAAAIHGRNRNLGGCSTRRRAGGGRHRPDAGPDSSTTVMPWLRHARASPAGGAEPGSPRSPGRRSGWGRAGAHGEIEAEASERDQPVGRVGHPGGA